MTEAANFHKLNLPDAAAQFALEDSGVIFFSGGPGSGRTTSAYALAEHIAATTDRTVTAITTDPESVPTGTTFPWRALRTHGHAGEAIDGSVADTRVIVVDAALSIDGLWAMVHAAPAGALIIATLEDPTEFGYVQLLDMQQAAEDDTGEYRKIFDAYLYAVITQTLVDTGAGKVLESEVHRGQWKNRAAVREYLRSARM